MVPARGSEMGDGPVPPPIPYLQDLLKEMYHSELERRDKINEGIALPAGVLAALVGVGAYYVEKLPPGDSPTLLVVFWASLSALMLAIVVAGYFLVRTLWNHTYALVTTPGNLARYAAELEGYHKELGRAELNRCIEEDLRSELLIRYARYGEINARSNHRKMRFLHLAHSMLICALVAFLVNTVTFYVLPYR